MLVENKMYMHAHKHTHTHTHTQTQTQTHTHAYTDTHTKHIYKQNELSTYSRVSKVFIVE